MLPKVDTRVPSEVEEQVQAIYRRWYSDCQPAFIACAFDWLTDSFHGQFNDYQPIDAQYHDLEHTLQGTLCLARIWDGRARVGAEPVLPRRMFELSLLAILFHDTGYLKKRNDTEGTGAKYTMTHVDRSAQFAREFLSGRGYGQVEIVAIQNMIHCTGVAVDLQAIAFQSELERLGGCALGTADLLGQMAADDYVDKLPTLFTEFQEAVHFSGPMAKTLASYKDAADLKRQTLKFWETYVLPRLNNEFQGLYHYLDQPGPGGVNPYVEKIQRNLERIRQETDQGTAP